MLVPDFSAHEELFSKLPRLSSRAFPSYRFIPGLNAHPHRDPAGHSFGHVLEVCLPLTEDNWRTHEFYLYGIDLYNRAYWWESHEAWETAWQALDKSSMIGQYLQGLIQISAAFIKWVSDQREGCQKLFELGLTRLVLIESQQPVFLGIDLTAHVLQLRKQFDWLKSSETNGPDPMKNYPFLKFS